MAVHKGSDSMRRGEVVRRYKVYWNKPEGNRAVLLQFPDRYRNAPYNESNNLKPIDVRIKPKAGFVEINVPLNRTGPQELNHAKAIQFGHALKKSKLLEQGGDYGLAGGFNPIKPPPRSRKGEQQQQEGSESEIEDIRVAEEKGLVLQKLTLGGRVQSLRDGDPIHAIGTFTKNGELHLTRINALCSLQPQFHYLDAIAENEKSQGRGGRGADDLPEELHNLSLRSPDEEELDMNETGKTLRALQDEPWKPLEWIDEDVDDSYTYYGDNLFHRGKKATKKQPKLLPAMTTEHYLDVLSAAKVEPSVLGERVMKAESHKPRLADILAEFSDDEPDAAFVDGEKEDEVMVEEGLRRAIAID